MKLGHTVWAPSGPKRRTILLLHGVTGWSKSWWRVGPMLASAGYCAIAVDLPGHGASPAPERGFSARSVRESIVETLVEAMGGRCVDVVWGHSLGGVVALDLLLADASLASAAVIVDPPLRPSTQADVDRLIETWTAHAVLARQAPAALIDLLQRQHPHWDDRDVEEGVMSMALVNLDTLRAVLAEPTPVDAQAALQRLEVPALLVLAAEDRGSAVVGRGRHTLLTQLPRHVEVLELDAGHLVHRDTPDLYVRSVLAWLAVALRLPDARMVTAPNIANL